MKRSKFGGLVAATGVMLAMVSCGSSSNSTATTTTTRAAAAGSTTINPATTAKAATTPSTSASTSAGKVQVTMSGDVNASLTPDATAPVACSQNPSKIVLKGDAGGHRGTITITPQGTGTSGNIDVAYLPDGVGGPQYLAAHIPSTGGDSRGFVNLNAAGSGNLDVVIPFVAGSSGSFNGSSVHVKATWTC